MKFIKKSKKQNEELDYLDDYDSSYEDNPYDYDSLDDDNPYNLNHDNSFSEENPYGFSDYENYDNYSDYDESNFEDAVKDGPKKRFGIGSLFGKKKEPVSDIPESYSDIMEYDNDEPLDDGYNYDIQSSPRENTNIKTSDVKPNKKFRFGRKRNEEEFKEEPYHNKNDEDYSDNITYDGSYDKPANKNSKKKFGFETGKKKSKETPLTEADYNSEYKNENSFIGNDYNNKNNYYSELKSETDDKNKADNTAFGQADNYKNYHNKQNDSESSAQKDIDAVSKHNPFRQYKEQLNGSVESIKKEPEYSDLTQEHKNNGNVDNITKKKNEELGPLNLIKQNKKLKTNIPVSPENTSGFNNTGNNKEEKVSEQLLQQPVKSDACKNEQTESEQVIKQPVCNNTYSVIDNTDVENEIPIETSENNQDDNLQNNDYQYDDYEEDYCDSEEFDDNHYNNEEENYNINPEDLIGEKFEEKKRFEFPLKRKNKQPKEGKIKEKEKKEPRQKKLSREDEVLKNIRENREVEKERMRQLRDDAIVSKTWSKNAEAKAYKPHGWSWAAFSFGLIWGIGNRCYKPYVPVVLLIAFSAFSQYAVNDAYNIIKFMLIIFSLLWCVICGIEGHTWAWYSNKINDVSGFEEAQRTWDRVGFIVLLGEIILIIAVVTSITTNGGGITENIESLTLSDLINTFKSLVEKMTGF